MVRKILAFSGIAAAIVYVTAVVLGGALRPGYSHISQFVSELIATGAPNKPVLDALFAAYNLLTAAFGWALLLEAHARKPATGRTFAVLGAGVLILEGILGLAILFFPQDPVGAPATPTGTAHIVLAGLSSLATMVAILVIALGLRRDSGLRAYATYSFATVAFIFLSGGVAAATAATGGRLAGLLERLPIAGFLQWLAVMSMAMSSRIGKAQ